MNLTFLGTGTSVGIPMIGCSCAVCTSTNSKDTRLRASVYIEYEEIKFLIDLSPDFRQQALVNKIPSIDAVLITHEHNDHIIGLDDIRPYNFLTRKDIPIYGESHVINILKEKFSYAFNGNTHGTPKLVGNSITSVPFTLSEKKIIPIPVEHGDMMILGYRLGDLAYLTDVSAIPSTSMDLLRDLDTLVINALRLTPHHKHFSLEEALQVIKQLKPKKAYLTHLSHKMPAFDALQSMLPPNVFIAYDSLRVKVG